jgi:MFS family permease
METAWHAALTAPFRYRGFIAFTRFYIVWVIATFLSAPFQQVFLMRRLDIPMDRIGLLTALTMLFTILTFRFWGTMADRHSNKAVFLTGFAGLLVVQAAYLLAAPGSYGILYPMSVLCGASSSAVNLTVNNLFYLVYPKTDDKIVVVGFYSAVIGLATFAGPIIGGATAAALSPFARRVSLLTFDNYRILFLVTGLLWAVSVPLLRLVPEEAPVCMRALVRDLLPAGPAGRRKERQNTGV